MSEYSELKMASAFNITIKSNKIKGIPDFKLLYREVICQQGIADFIGVASDEHLEQFSLEITSSFESCCMVLSLLKYKAGRSKKYLKIKSGLSDSILNRTLKELTTENIITTKNELYILNVKDVFFDSSNIWAFELKLSNWKRALFQALQYKAFANYSVVVFPLEKEKLLFENLKSFIDFNIGVLLYDPETDHYKWLKHPRKEKPISKWQSLFLRVKMLSQNTNENNITIIS